MRGSGRPANTNLGTRPPEWWREHPDVPDELRSMTAWCAASGVTPESVDPRPRLTAPGQGASAFAQLRRAREDWLIASGEADDIEVAAIRRSRRTRGTPTTS